MRLCNSALNKSWNTSQMSSVGIRVRILHDVLRWLLAVAMEEVGVTGGTAGG